MIMLEATPQYEPAYRQSRVFSGDGYMRAQNMVRTAWEPKSPSTTTPPRENDPFLGVRFDVQLSNRFRHEHHRHSNPRRITPNPHSLD